MTIGDRNIGWLVNWELFLPALLSLTSPQHLCQSLSVPYYWWTRLPWYNSNKSWWGIQSEESILFQQRNLATNTEVQIFILAASHSAANDSSMGWRSLFSEPIRADLSGESRARIEKSPDNTFNYTFCYTFPQVPAWPLLSNINGSRATTQGLIWPRCVASTSQHTQYLVTSQLNVFEQLEKKTHGQNSNNTGKKSYTHHKELYESIDC